MERLFRRRDEKALEAIDAEITEFGELLAAHTLAPGQLADEALAADYQRALDAYERAKRDFVGDRDRADAEDVLRALDEGRHALACVDARLNDQPLPARRRLCFFDARHGSSTETVAWTPPEGATRMIDVCAADAVRLAEGMSPIATGKRPAPVPTPRRGSRRPAARKPAAAGPQGAARPAPPFTMWPSGTPKAQRAEGRRGAKVVLRRPYLNKPLLLVVRLHGMGRHEVDLVDGSGTRALLRDKGRTRVVVPLPPHDVREVRVQVATDDRWWAWLQAPADLPLLTDGVGGRGWCAFSYEGGPATVTVEHRGRGAYSLTSLTPELRQGEPLLTGMNSSVAEARLERHTLLHLRANGEWTIRLT